MFSGNHSSYWKSAIVLSVQTQRDSFNSRLALQLSGFTSKSKIGTWGVCVSPGKLLSQNGIICVEHLAPVIYLLYFVFCSGVSVDDFVLQTTTLPSFLQPSRLVSCLKERSGWTVNNPLLPLPSPPLTCSEIKSCCVVLASIAEIASRN